jgi:hypothetical protein
MERRCLQMENISELSNANRVEIFKHIAVDELNGVQLNILDSIASKHFHTFLDFCDKVFNEKELIEDVSCTLEGDELNFIINYK